MKKCIIDIRQHRFMPNISISSKIIIDKKTKNNHRRILNKNIDNDG